MTGLAMNVQVRADEALRYLAERREAASGTSRLMDVIGEIVVSSVRRNFELGQSPEGTPWEESSRAKAEGGKTLIDTAILMNSIGYQTTGNSVEVGTPVAYAAIHHFGGKTPPRTIRPRNARALFWPGARHPVAKVDHPGSDIPARPFLGIRAEDWLEIADAVRKHFMGEPA